MDTKFSSIHGPTLGEYSRHLMHSALFFVNLTDMMSTSLKFVCKQNCSKGLLDINIIYILMHILKNPLFICAIIERKSCISDFAKICMILIVVFHYVNINILNLGEWITAPVRFC